MPSVTDYRECTRCHLGGPPLPGVSGRVDDRDNRRKPNLVGYEALPPQLDVGTPTWEYVDRLRAITKGKLFITLGKITTLLDTTDRFFTPLSRSASIRASGMPHRPKPPTASVWPSATMSLSASAAEEKTLFTQISCCGMEWVYDTTYSNT